MRSIAYRHAANASARCGRARGDRHAGLADLQASDPVIDRQPRAGPALGGLVADPLERLQRECVEALVVQEQHLPAGVVIPNQADERGDGAVVPLR